MSRFIIFPAACLLIQVSFGTPPTAGADNKVAPKPLLGALRQVQGPCLAQVLIVAEVDKPNGRIHFESWRTVKHELPLGRREFIDTATPVKVAFSLKDWKAITADGKEVKDADLWKRVAVGKPVVILSLVAQEVDEKLAKEIRALFKDDTILLVPVTKPLPKEKAQTPPVEDPKKSPAKP